MSLRVPLAPNRKRFAQEWIAAWNAHDLEAILSHYAEGIVFESPFVSRLTGDPKGIVRGRESLRAYFAAALAAYPDLRFELTTVYEGVGTVVLAYRSVKNLNAAEVMQLDAQGCIARVWAHYSDRVG